MIQSLIYSYEESKSILIVIDLLGIRFYNLRGSYSYKDWFYNNRLIKEYDSNCEGMADFIDDGNKLLYVYGRYFAVFNLKDFKIIDNSLILSENVNCLLGMKDGNALVGTNNGNIYLIKI